MKYLLTAVALVAMVAGSAAHAAPVPGVYSLDSYAGDGVTKVLKAPFVIDSAAGGTMTGTLNGIPFTGGTYSGSDIAFTMNTFTDYEGKEGFALVGHYVFSGGSGASWIQSDSGTLLGKHTLTNTLGAGFATARFTINVVGAGVFSGFFGEDPLNPGRPIVGTFNEATMEWTMLDDIVGGINYAGTYGMGWAGTWRNSLTDTVGTFQIVPEPSSMLALFGGLAAFGGALLRRKS